MVGQSQQELLDDKEFAFEVNGTVSILVNKNMVKEKDKKEKAGEESVPVKNKLAQKALQIKKFDQIFKSSE